MSTASVEKLRPAMTTPLICTILLPVHSFARLLYTPMAAPTASPADSTVAPTYTLYRPLKPAHTCTITSIGISSPGRSTSILFDLLWRASLVVCDTSLLYEHYDEPLPSP